MAVIDRIDGYADAALAVAEAEGQAELVGSELTRLGRAVASSTELADALGNASIPVERKLGIVTDLVGGRVSPATLHLASLIVSLGHGGDLAAIAERMAARASERRGSAVAEIRAAVELDHATLNRIAGALAQRVGRPVEARLVIDESVVGGFVASVGDIVIDASVKRRLEEVGRQLTSG